MIKSRMKDKMSLFLGLGILILCMLCAPACAAYGYEGYPLATNESGVIQGDVYVSCGDHAGLNDTTWSYATNTFTTNFTNVPTSGVKFAELKVGVWGGSTSRQGWANTMLNGTTLSNETLSTGAGLSSYIDCSGSGLYVINYDCTDRVRALNNGVINATIVANPRNDLGTSYRLDSRIYGAVLIVGYENGEEYTQYWINQGNLNLHKNVTSGGIYYPDLDASLTQFNGAVNGSVGGNATLTVGYFAGDDDQNDYIYFNAPDDDYSPYDLSNFNWPIPSYTSYQLDSDNVANETCDELIGTTTNFDLHKFSLNVSHIDTSGNNYAVLWRGHGNNTGESEIYDPPYTTPPTVNPNTESYVSPFLAVLKIKS